MLRNFTINGTSIPQDLEGNDMCVLFIKYGRCRFKQKCKKSHWVPPLPEEPYPVEEKPPVPDDKEIDKEKQDGLPNKLTLLDTTTTSSESQMLTCQTWSSELQGHHSSFDENVCEKENRLNIAMSGDKNYLQNVSNFGDKGGFLNKIDVQMEQRTNADSDSQTLRLKKRSQLGFMPRRFKHVFKDNEVTGLSGVERMFDEAGIYYDNVRQKVEPVNLPQTKIEKHHLKLVRRLHWNNMQTLKQRLNQYPPSYFLKFDRSKVNFTRLRPYIYVLVHECLCPGGVTKPVKPCSFHYLVADTLIVYLEFKHASAQTVEMKFQQWGARAVRARQCIDHLWHLMAISSKSSDGCADVILSIEQEVLRGSRMALDYAYACSFALKQTKLKEATMSDKYIPRKVCSSVRQGLEAAKNVSKKKNSSFDKLQSERVCHKRNTASQKVNGAREAKFSKIEKKRQRSKQFKNVSLNERKKIKTRYLNLLTTLT